MRYWFDTEFIEDGRTIELLSIGIVSQDGRQFYRQADWTDWTRASPWVQSNVLPHLIRRRDDPSWATREEMRIELVKFCDPTLFGKPEFWGYYADYDWVALCQVFGTMLNLPETWPKYCRDIKQWCDDLGNPPLPKQAIWEEHHALSDALWNKQAWGFLDLYRLSETR